MKDEKSSYPLVSIIIPVYNVEPYIEEALDSVINQTYQRLEIIVIDDGSTDRSGAICDEYAKKDKRIRVIHQRNRGLSAARNVGLDHAMGDVIAFLDPDDAYVPEMIRSLVDVIGVTDIAVCDFFTMKTEGILRARRRAKNYYNISVLTREEALLKVYNHSINSAVWNKIYKKEILSDLRFPEGHVYEGTYIIFDIFNKAERIAFFEEKLIIHRIRPGSICNTYSVKNILDCEYARESFTRFVRDHTPEIFSIAQYEKLKLIRICGLIAGYGKFLLYSPDDKKRRRFRKVLEKIGRDSLYDCSAPIKAGYQFIMNCPSIVLLIYLPYHYYKRMISFFK